MLRQSPIFLRGQRLRLPAAWRAYHDESFGYRAARVHEVPDYTPEQLANRAANGSLQRYADMLRSHGHRAANIDPLGLVARDPVAALDPSRYHLSGAYDVDGIIFAGEGQQGPWELKDIVEHLNAVYVGRVAYEYMHSPHKAERLWFMRHLEAREQRLAPNRKRIHSLLAKSEALDKFLQLKFPNLKRYGLEGGESMIPALDSLFRVAAQAGVEHTVLAMPHRGRLNVLLGLLGYPPAGLFRKIKGGSEIPEEFTEGEEDVLDYRAAEGDVLSHLTAVKDLEYDGRHIEVELLPNPSHLEAINPVALGKARAKQYSLLKSSPADCALGDRVLCVQVHGDASFTGQGVVMEGIGLSNLPHYTTGGSVHLVVNNNIGYTTPAHGARSSMYCSDIGKMVGAPVLHVNGDYPEDVERAMEVAFAYRDRFRKDVIVDLLVYRRWGHNELDVPDLTSPKMYEKIRARQSVPQLYASRLVADGTLTAKEAERERTEYRAQLEAELAREAATDPTTGKPAYQPEWKASPGWEQIVWPASAAAVREPSTGVEESTLAQIGRASVAVPEGFALHDKLRRHIKHRLQAIDAGKGLDWATAEAMAFGALLLEGNDVRISGQDVGRGTFSQRHAMLVDQQTERTVVPLNDWAEKGDTGKKGSGRLELANSSLSEMAVLGFEYGASWERPTLLPIWEAQFGDFFNGAQVIIDTFISSAETKWLRQSGIVLLLPHGLDGAGPEHSSSRIERMLQLTNDPFASQSTEPNVNMHVTFPTTPAQYFHLLRRQMARNFRKPLIVAGPKGLLRLPAAGSSLADMAPGTTFQPVLDDPAISDPSKVDRVLLVSGKLYYELAKARDASSPTTAIVRLEELAPFPFARLRSVLERYANASRFVYVQEEPRNQGAWGHVAARASSGVLPEGKELEYVGRGPSALPAPGLGTLYKAQQAEIIRRALA
ncbi:2-oxoglutarate dehydrogenase, E1 component [Schizophyllum commune H4-8]|uniref:2-oxoglutarate dehydrogenase, E1 component n=1 Tax=Schizophyllum commune (strain H4-8 / FGSC 9210) TaxID=578458 RepID=UPI00215DEC53|nr:2-oxoglutarate dehydrogenase, E1 component [Schizophyllum commune H4-8]KAI5886780.1 2-oxoglutarate dehydrogenase, E1 component [Schizophyllum commune H4-8]